MSKYRNFARIEQEEKELEELEAAYKQENDPDFNPAQEIEDDLPTINKEEETWKKRHGDLRSYTQRQMNDLNKQVEDLKKQLAEKEKTPAILPQNVQEAEQWVKEYPDLARVLTTLMKQNDEEVREDIKAAKMELEEQRLNAQREKAVLTVLAKHPDFFDVRDTDEFKEWLETQRDSRGRIGAAIYDSIHNNETDGESVVETLNIFKRETKKEVKKPTPSAATSVTKTHTNSPAENPGDRNSFSESQVEKMSIREYERLEDQIDAAKREGRFIYDISGAAR